MVDLVIVGAKTPTVIRVIEDINAHCNNTYRVLGFVDSDPQKRGALFKGLPVLGGFESCLSLDRNNVLIINTIAGSLGDRIETTNWFLERGFSFANVTHPSVNLASCEVGQGNIFYENATVQPYVKIGNHCIISSNSGIAHDCKIGDFCFVGPASYICGDVTVESRAYIGVGAKILPRLTIGSDVTIAAGAVVLESVSQGARMRGVPALPF